MKASQLGDTHWGSVQVTSDHYITDEYLHPARFMGLQAQLKACFEAGREKSFLEIGPGPGLLSALLHHFGYRVGTLDFAGDLNPNVVARLPELPIIDQAFDVVCAFEVLEHIPFSLLGACLGEMQRVARERLIITVPDQCNILQNQVRLDLTLGRNKISKTFWRRPLRRLTNPKEHYWEVGHDGISPEKVLAIAQAEGLIPVSTYFVEPWFRFFVLTIKH